MGSSPEDYTRRVADQELKQCLDARPGLFHPMTSRDTRGPAESSGCAFAPCRSSNWGAAPACASVATIARDVSGPDQASMTGHTARSYLTGLHQLMVVEDQPAWAPHLRSRSRLRVSPKRHFVDPSIATAALSAGPRHLLRDFPWFGFLFESLVIRDLRVYAQAMGARVYHYRDHTSLEVDAVVDAGPGRWAAFEIKLGLSRIDDAARSLLKFADRVDTSRCGEPAALGVIVERGFGYVRPDGVSVIPLGALGP